MGSDKEKGGILLILGFMVLGFAGMMTYSRHTDKAVEKMNDRVYFEKAMQEATEKMSDTQIKHFMDLAQAVRQELAAKGIKPGSKEYYEYFENFVRKHQPPKQTYCDKNGCVAVDEVLLND